jgi:hypothetical protein
LSNCGLKALERAMVRAQGASHHEEESDATLPQ